MQTLLHVGSLPPNGTSAISGPGLWVIFTPFESDSNYPSNVFWPRFNMAFTRWNWLKRDFDKSSAWSTHITGRLPTHLCVSLTNPRHISLNAFVNHLHGQPSSLNDGGLIDVCILVKFDVFNGNGFKFKIV